MHKNMEQVFAKGSVEQLRIRIDALMFGLPPADISPPLFRSDWTLTLLGSGELAYLALYSSVWIPLIPESSESLLCKHLPSDCGIVWVS